MENDILTYEASPGNQVYPYTHFYGALFLGGPLAGGYMMAENYKALGQTEKVTITWVVTIITTIAVFGLSFLIGHQKNFPNLLIPVLYSSLGSMMVRNLQGKQIDEHILNGGGKYNWKRTLVVSLVALLITLVLLVIVSAMVYLITDAKGTE